MINNQEVAQNLVEMLETSIEAAGELQRCVEQRDDKQIETLIHDLKQFLLIIQQAAIPLAEEEKQIKLPDAALSALDSLNRIAQWYQKDPTIAEQKLEFELIPILEIACVQFEYWACVYPDVKKTKAYLETRVPLLAGNKYIKASSESGQYKYDLSIVITAYNKLDYTKMCVAALLQHLPKSVTYELILVNHGSTDGTKEFFESIKPKKQVDILINNSVPLIATKIIEGRYGCTISNDVLVTQNAIDNMVRCMMSDQKIAWIVPTTPNVSNLQTVEAEYSTMEEMFEFCKMNNQYEPRRHEQRTRLCDPAEVLNSAVHQQAVLELYQALALNLSVQSFPDDKMSLWCRRNGYKMILAKDAYCYHFGSVTLKDEILQHQNEAGEDFYLQGRKHFQSCFGVDPWGTGYCYDSVLVNSLPCNDTLDVNILGVNCGLGSNPLKIRELIYENTGNINVRIYNFSADRQYLMDLRGVSDYVKQYKKASEIIKFLAKTKFKYIVIEDIEEAPEWFLGQILKHVSPKVHVCMHIKKKMGKVQLPDHCKPSIQGNWLILNIT